MTPAFIKQRLKDAGLTNAAGDEKLCAWIAAAIEEGMQAVNNPEHRQQRLEAIALLKEAPPYRTIENERYRKWGVKVAAWLRKAETA